mgnify:CR=1 FL=1
MLERHPLKFVITYLGPSKFVVSSNEEEQVVQPACAGGAGRMVKEASQARDGRKGRKDVLSRHFQFVLILVRRAIVVTPLRIRNDRIRNDGSLISARKVILPAL